MMKRIHEWATAILVIPRWLLTIKYALFALFGIAAIIAGAPSLYATVGALYAFYWAIGLTIASIVACVSSLFESDRAETVEKWAAVAIVAFLSANVAGAITLVGLGEGNRVAFSVLLLIVTLLPAARAVALMLAPRGK